MEEERDFEEIRVGEKFKTLREQKGLSLKELADLTGFSTALLSQMENHLVSPSLGTIIKLAKALGVRVGDFMGETEGEPFTIVRKDERKHISRFASKEGVKYGYSYESLGFEKKNRHMEPFIVTLEPATVKTSKTSVHEGEEFIFVLEGEMEVISWKPYGHPLPRRFYLLRFQYSSSSSMPRRQSDENFSSTLCIQYVIGRWQIADW